MTKQLVGRGLAPASFNGSLTALSSSVWDGTCLAANGKLYVTTNNGVLLQWDNPFTDISAYSSIATVTAQLSSLVEDTINSCFYFGTQFTTSGNKRATIFKLDPAGPTVSTVVSAADLGFNPSMYVASPLCTDGTSIYLLAASNTSGTNDKVFKFKISDGTTTASIQLPDTSLGAGQTRHGNYIGITQAGNILCAGGLGSYYALLPASLGSVTTTIVVDASATVDDDYVMLGTNLWSQRYLGAGDLWKVSQDLSTVTAYDTGHANGSDGMFYDGTHIWCQERLTGAQTLINPADGSVFNQYTDLVGSGYPPLDGGIQHDANEVFVKLGTSYISISYRPTLNSWMARVSLP